VSCRVGRTQVRGWLATSRKSLILLEMNAKQYGADRIWIVNVGHFKGYELPTEFFFSL
jgi:hypothetical protein